MMAPKALTDFIPQYYIAKYPKLGAFCEMMAPKALTDFIPQYYIAK